jgi:hypothetical protein
MEISAKVGASWMAYSMQGQSFQPDVFLHIG